ncbi:hypothetical protein [Microvirga arsenatis]|uniref:Uncharacterized protein n=1 Tax=Microvirga arsenatis TaxID=2692265 RepID=A0ABW9Z3D6_9HYPH|nr:hypothetical protein [Microvirga arsenatis]NBJ13756.1 hypothetical protein [Microvirga arsenatis]NBJ27204.1 hypothetical protein [Microvirga arsenatis]
MRESLELDVYESRTMQERAASEDYAVELYNALCGIIWQKAQSTELWSCTWRRAGEIVARVRSRYVSGDYIDFYCNFDREGTGREPLPNACGRI